MKRKLLLTFVSMMLFIGQSFAQTTDTKKKTSKKKVTVATVKTPPPIRVFEPEIVGTADEPQNNSVAPGNPPLPENTSIPAAPKVSTSKKLETLEQKVDALTNKMSSIEAQQRSLLDLEILSRAEQRAESLRKSFLEMTEREATLQARLGQIEIDILPESIDRSLAAVGSLRPEELREQRRKTLENERASLRIQIDQILNAKVKLQVSVDNADKLVEKLRIRLEKELDEDKKDDGEFKPNDD